MIALVIFVGAVGVVVTASISLALVTLPAEFDTTHRRSVLLSANVVNGVL